MEEEETMALWRMQKEADAPGGQGEGREWITQAGWALQAIWWGCAFLSRAAGSQSPCSLPRMVKSTSRPIRKSLPLAKLPPYEQHTWKSETTLESPVSATKLTPLWTPAETEVRAEVPLPRVYEATGFHSIWGLALSSTIPTVAHIMIFPLLTGV